MNKTELFKKALEDGARIDISFHNCSSSADAEMKVKSIADVLGVDFEDVNPDDVEYGWFTTTRRHEGIEVTAFYNSSDLLAEFLPNYEYPSKKHKLIFKAFENNADIFIHFHNERTKEEAEKKVREIAGLLNKGYFGSEKGNHGYFKTDGDKSVEVAAHYTIDPSLPRFPKEETA